MKRTRILGHPSTRVKNFLIKSFRPLASPLSSAKATANPQDARRETRDHSDLASDESPKAHRTDLLFILRSTPVYPLTPTLALEARLKNQADKAEQASELGSEAGRATQKEILERPF